MKKINTIIVVLLFVSLNGFSRNITVEEKLEKATKAGKTVFLVVFNKSDENKTKALSIANQASAKKPETTQVLEIDATAEDNNGLINKFRLSGAPLPLILVIDKNGITIGGIPFDKASPDALIAIIPSPQYSEVRKALSEKKSIFIVAYKETMVDKTKAFEVCKEAAKKMNNKSVIVKLNIDDTNETELINQLKVSTLSTKPSIIVINQQGQIAGTYNPETESERLVTAANKVIHSSCCPGSSKKKCGEK